MVNPFLGHTFLADMPDMTFAGKLFIGENPYKMVHKNTRD